MAISFRAAGAVVTGSGVPVSLTPTAPAGTAATDLVLVVLKFGGGTGVTITPPGGWTLANRTDNATTDGCAVYWGLGSAAFTAWTLAGIIDTITTFALGYIGVNNTTPMDVAALGQNNVSATTEPTPAITPVTPGAWLVGFGGYRDAAQGVVPTYSAPSIDAVATTLRQSGGVQGVAAGGDTTAAGGYDAAWTAGAMSGTVTTSLANISQGIIVALRPRNPFEEMDDESRRIAANLLMQMDQLTYSGRM
jgi:hypothetical protein